METKEITYAQKAIRKRIQLKQDNEKFWFYNDYDYDDISYSDSSLESE